MSPWPLERLERGEGERRTRQVDGAPLGFPAHMPPHSRSVEPPRLLFGDPRQQAESVDERQGPELRSESDSRFVVAALARGRELSGKVTLRRQERMFAASEVARCVRLSELHGRLDDEVPLDVVPLEPLRHAHNPPGLTRATLQHVTGRPRSRHSLEPTQVIPVLVDQLVARHDAGA